ncbi:MAG: tRNA (guanosine(37)-N1)-methyltransferase TrmD [Candidatus Uhrbacteria bacterium]
MKKRIDIITIFPEVCSPYLEASILGRAQKKRLLDLRVHNLREYTKDKHHNVDDTPYGGGPGMVMQVEPFDRALKKIRKQPTAAKALAGRENKKVRIILTSASGKRFTQKDAKRLAKYDQIIFLCGRYEGVDARVEKHLADESLSIGDYVLTGGELPALVMADAIARMVPGVLGKAESLDTESHTVEGVLEYPQYTKPEKYGRWKVPEVLLSGDHKKIEEWRRKNSQGL